MLQFTVPQFIDVEDKIFGPITVRQFIIMLVGTLLIALGYRLFDFMLFVVSGLLIFAISTTFAFVKINGAAFHFFLLNIVQTFKKPRLRIWHKDDTLKTGVDIDNLPSVPVAVVSPHHYSASRLNELSLIVDTQGSYQGEESDSVVIRPQAGRSADF